MPNKETTLDGAAQAEFNEKKRVWVQDDSEGFLPGWIKNEIDASFSGEDITTEVVITTTNETRTVPHSSLSPMNPPQFDGVEDIAELTHLNEASVVNNLRHRYGANGIYTYSGLFLISLNPYRPLPIYTPKIISQYRSKRREENPPHIFAIAERAWQQIGEERDSQSILITGESGAGKTENTKKVIQYLAAIATAADSTTNSAPLHGLPSSSSFKSKDLDELNVSGNGLGLLEQQILQANPILESFGNAQTMRNNNSSRFGKFIRIFLAPNGSIAGANIDWYLLEKSRVTSRSEGERSFHIFYQLLAGAKESGLIEPLLLDSNGSQNYNVLTQSRLHVDGIDDLSEWRQLKDALRIVGFSKEEEFELFRVVATILHIGNISLVGSSADQAFLPPESQPTAEKVCQLLGVPLKEFVKSTLSPKVRAGREWVTHARSKKQAEDELAALSKFMYEKTFGWMVDRINKALDRPSTKALFIGVLDIAGFEIFEENSYEQLLINFTNEKLQQFFNHHMFKLEQDEYKREGISWDYVNFGLDLQPTIDLIECQQPVGILSLLDEECIMPKATDVTFTEKVQGLWEPPKGARGELHPGTAKFKPVRFGKGFVVRHYAGDVEYRTEGWLNKNKDPINDAVAGLLSQSNIPAIARMFAEYAEDSNAAVTAPGKRKRRGAFRTVGQRHKEQLGQLMTQLSRTQPHFVRCIVPNGDKKPGRVDVNLVLDQLRCNGVLEGIRIARLGYPNRHSFAEFRQRYEVLVPGLPPKTQMDGRKAALRIAEALDLDPDFYAIGATKIFFKAGILAELEEQRDKLLNDIFRRFQSVARMHICRRRINKLINRSQAVRTIQHNARAYIALRDWPWWSLYTKVRPLLAATRTDDELARQQAELAMANERAERDEQEKRRLEELRASLVADKEKIEQELLSERDLTLEKDNMLNRSKAHEAQLQDRVAELEALVGDLERKHDEAVATGEQHRSNLNKITHKHDRLVDQVSILEKEGTAWRAREGDLLRQSKDRSEAQSKLENAKFELGKQLDSLRREVSQKEEQQRRAKEKKEAELSDLLKQLQEEKNKSQKGNDRAASLNKDLVRQQTELNDLKETIKGHEATISAKQQALLDLDGKRSTAARDLASSEEAKAALQIKVNSLAADLVARNEEREKEVAERKKLEKSLDELRKVMDAKASEEVQRREADQSRAAEMADLRKQVSSLQKQMEHQREKYMEAANKLRVDVDGLRQRHATAVRDLQTANETVRSKESEVVKMQKSAAEDAKTHKQVRSDLEAAQTQIEAKEQEIRRLKTTCQQLEDQVQDREDMLVSLEDALLPIEHERDSLRDQLSSTNAQLSEEISKRQRLQSDFNAQQEELANHRNEVQTIMRELADATQDIKIRDDEISLLHSRENKTIVEHVHVLETAKKLTDRQLHEQVNENIRLNQLLKSLETQKRSVQADLDDALRTNDLLRKKHNQELRGTRVSLGPEDKDLKRQLEDERRKRHAAESKASSLERDLAKHRERSAASALSPKRTVSGSTEVKLQRTLDELARLRKSHDASLADNRRLTAELASRSAQNGVQPRAGSSSSTSNRPPSGIVSSRAELLRGLQQSHDAMGRDMQDQMRRLDSGPLTPSRRQDSVGNGAVAARLATSNTGPQMSAEAKRIRTLEAELESFRQQLEDSREEKELMWNQMQGGLPEKVRKQFPFEQAMFSHFRLKAKSLRQQLDHWLAMEDLNQNQSKGALSPQRTGPGSVAFTEDVVRLKQLLSQLDPETSPLRAT